MVAPTHADIIDFSNFLLQLKNRRSRNKTLRGFLIILIWKELCLFKFKEYNLNFNKNETKWKAENSIHTLREMKNCELKGKL